MKRHRLSNRSFLVVSFVLGLVCSVPALFFAGPASAAPSPSPGTSTGAPSPTIPASAKPPIPGDVSVTPGSGVSSTSSVPAPVAPPAAADTNPPLPRLGAGLIGTGSSFAGPEVQQWTTDTAKPPYLLSVDYTFSSSGQGRFDFGNNTVDFAVSDIPYQGVAFDTAQPKFAFTYVPVTAGGLAFMYHLDGLPAGTTLRMSSYSICAVMTGGVTKWNDHIIQDDNPGVTLPSTTVHPVIRSDLAGTNFVLQEYCIHEQPALWKAFIDSPATQQYPGQVGDLSDSQPRSDWPQFPGAISASGSSNAADDVAQPHSDGYLTAVETAYAIQRNFPVASVKNASGDYNQPGAVNVASALAYATQNADGTHTLNFDGAGPHVYNPSTYSYLLTPTTGWSAAKGATLSQFANYSLTLGQQRAPEIGYASLGLSLEQYGVNSIKQSVPGAVALTASEQGAYQCGDLTPAEVAQGQTQPTCGVTNPNNSTTPGTTGGSGKSSTTTTARGTATGATPKVGSGGSGSAGTGSTTGSGIDPGVSLSGSPALASTGVDPLPVLVSGLLLLTSGWLLRRRLRGWMQ